MQESLCIVLHVIEQVLWLKLVVDGFHLK